MTTIEKKTGLISFKKLSIVFAIMFTLVSNLIQSQNTSTTTSPDWFEESRPIRYRELNEVMKLAEYKGKAEKRDSIQNNKIAIQDSIISAQNDIINRYKNRIVPNLESQISLLLAKEQKQNELDAIREEKWQLKIDKIKGKRLGVGGYIGYGAVLDGYSIKGLPSIGLSLHYTVFRL